MRKALNEAGACGVCGAKLPGWALYVPEADEPASDAICGACINSSIKVAPDHTPEGWESEKGKYLKAERNLALSYDQTGWVTMPDAPVTEECRQRVLGYRAILNRMTIDFTPETWVWPERPTLSYLG